MATTKVYTLTIDAILGFDVKAETREEAIAKGKEILAAKTGWTWDELPRDLTSAYVSIDPTRDDVLVASSRLLDLEHVRHSSNKNIETSLLGAAVRYRGSVMDLTPEQAAHMIEVGGPITGLSDAERLERDRKIDAAWPMLDARVVNVYLYGGSTRYTLRIVETGKLVDAGNNQIRVL